MFFCHRLKGLKRFSSCLIKFSRRFGRLSRFILKIVAITNDKWQRKNLLNLRAKKVNPQIYSFANLYGKIFTQITQI
ncbi:hypothetical protein B0A64_04250 [Flavobacterium araucananum]|uniref:Transposase DDE domain-containing protein n=1 Tax=Flavobacterium araucananum TaxID=946678 RepID=A0A227PHW5_9FLAO|nr:hypothetical protein B0A64_04250 [Flavobacterium araucananum]